jgi:hypothetical protein
VRASAFALLVALITGASCNAILGLESPSESGAGGGAESSVAAGAPCDGNTCDDGKINCDETGVDCGGRDCKACGGDPCMFNEDCQSRSCVAALGTCCFQPCPDKTCSSCAEPGHEGQCLAAQAGTPCETAYHCNLGFCQELPSVGDSCNNNGGCQTDLCQDSVCLGGAGWLCANGTECASGDCDVQTGCVGD